MKAAQIRRFGEPDVQENNDVDRPVAGTGEVLVSVEAASVNGHDVLVRAGPVTAAGPPARREAREATRANP